MDVLNKEWITGRQDMPPELNQLIAAEEAWSYRIVPVEMSSKKIVFISDHANDGLSGELEVLLGVHVEIVRVSQDMISRLLSSYYRITENANTSVKTTDKLSLTNEFLEKIIVDAQALGSSDIHIESFEHRGRIRIRIDGKLLEKFAVDKSDMPSLINKIKIKANLDIAEKRLPQDGRIQIRRDTETFDIRVSSIPTLYGEKIVLRILGKDASHIDLERLGLSGKEYDVYTEATRKPHGIILISGPTGSGKTTTLYATLKLLNQSTRNILTIEDPIEYTLDGINQVQVKDSIGLTFESVLKSFLRQDPDIIMVGEIRNRETAQMAIRAALTGHLVLSTIHTNSAWGTVTRLLDMGVPSFLIADTLNISVAQRLVRLLCPHCKQKTPMSETDIPTALRGKLKLHFSWTPVGCMHCHHTGYKGRKAIYEIIPIDEFFAQQIRNGVMDISNLLAEHEIYTLAQNAIQLMSEGQTSVDEVYSIIVNS